MTTTPRQRAERCFALARSTTFEGERSAAISRGMAICEREGLDLDTFDIPGRERKAKAAPSPAPKSYSSNDASEAVRRFREHLRRSAAEASKATEAFAKAQAEAAKRAAAEKIKRADEAANRLFELGTVAYRMPDALDGSRRWFVVEEGIEITDDQLIVLERRKSHDKALKDAAARAGVEVPTEEQMDRYRKAFTEDYEQRWSRAFWGERVKI